MWVRVKAVHPVDVSLVVQLHLLLVEVLEVLLYMLEVIGKVTTLCRLCLGLGGYRWSVGKSHELRMKLGMQLHRLIFFCPVCQSPGILTILGQE